MEAVGVPGRVPPELEPRHHGARRAHRGIHGDRSPGEVDCQLRQSLQGPDPDAPGAGRVPQHRGRVDHSRDRLGQGDRHRQRAGDSQPLQPYITTALGASEVRLRELAGAYRAMASGILAEPYIIDRVIDASGSVLYEASRVALPVDSSYLSLIREGLRGVVRLPEGTAHALDGRDFPIPVMGKTGTTSDFRDALFVGSTYGPQGITVAVWIGFDDNRTLGAKETGVARRCRSSARSCSASTSISSWGPCPSSLVSSRNGSPSTWRGRPLPRLSTRRHSSRSRNGPRPHREAGRRRLEPPHPRNVTSGLPGET